MIKKDFPIFTNHPELVYLDNAATTQKPTQVIEAIKNYYENSNANVHRGIHKLAEESTILYENSRQKVADFIGASPDEVIFTSGTTESINLIADILCQYNSDNTTTKTILLTELEHHSNILPWQKIAEILKWKIEYVKVDDKFALDLTDLKYKLNTNDVSIFALTNMSNVTGTIISLEDVSKHVKTNSPDTLIVVDGAQYLPHHRIDLSKLPNIDFYAFSGHKMMAPTGIGVLYGKKSLLDKFEPMKRGGGMINKVEREHSTYSDIPEKYEAGTPNIEGAIGLASAIDYLIKNIDNSLIDNMSSLSSHTLDSLLSIPELTILGPQDSNNRGPVFSFSIKNIHPHDVAQFLDNDNIAVRAGHHCTQILHREVFNLPATTRASLYYYNEKNDINKLVESLKKLITTFK
jgi:cysteine desulfurase / selenocysteine lyase